MNEIVVICPVCTYEVSATLAGTGLMLASHPVPGTKFPCPQGGTMVISGSVQAWHGSGPPGGSGAQPGRR